MPQLTPHERALLWRVAFQTSYRSVAERLRVSERQAHRMTADNAIDLDEKTHRLALGLLHEALQRRPWLFNGVKVTRQTAPKVGHARRLRVPILNDTRAPTDADMMGVRAWPR